MTQNSLLDLASPDMEKGSSFDPCPQCGLTFGLGFEKAELIAVVCSNCQFRGPGKSTEAEAFEAWAETVRDDDMPF